MSVLETPSPIIGKMVIRKARIKANTAWNRGRMEFSSETVQCMDGDVANLDDIEGIDFSIPNTDLIEYITSTF